jgi:hypothetical protein
MSDRGTVTTVRGTRVPSGYGVVVMGTNDVTTLRFQEMGKSELPPPLAIGCVKLIRGVLENGMQRWRPGVSHFHKDGTLVISLAGKAQAGDVVDNEL